MAGAERLARARCLAPGARVHVAVKAGTALMAKESREEDGGERRETWWLAGGGLLRS